jgi:hypothetical protein
MRFLHLGQRSILTSPVSGLTAIWNKGSSRTGHHERGANGVRFCFAIQSVTPADLPDGLIFRIRVKPPRQKYFAFPEI